MLIANVSFMLSYLARRKMASCKMKQIRKNGGCKETEELNNEDNEELFADIGLCSLKILWMKSIYVVAFLSQMCQKTSLLSLKLF